ncbi:peptidoglycan DD-metalloendopeptidase family protein [Dyella amyloliquefaciens]|uniref:peptidoglycan DD-metalloendopeptidase family protein n=1 Tax=Dyella amyloliquefaciens TaxID=1770545 RepID=UPI00102E8BF7|nr:peptidoglycan DD-metalloendopeptidase family protein [Dyella amyloliquefaciens]
MLPAMNGYLRSVALASAILALAACGTQRSVVVEPSAGATSSHATTVAPATVIRSAPGGSYKVAKGDTLYSIAFRNGVDFRDLASWNNIDAPYTIWPGQELKLAPVNGKPATASASAHVAPAVAASTGKPATTPPPAAPHPGNPAGTSSVATTAAPAQTPPPAPTPEPAASTTPVVPVAGGPAATAANTPPPTPPAAIAPGATRANGGVTWRWPADGSLIKRFQSGDAIPGIEIAGKSGDPVRAAADGVVVYSGNGLVGYGELVIVKHNDSYLSAYGHNSKRLVKEGQRVTAGQQIAEMGSTGAARDELQFQIRKDGNPVDPMGYLPSR